MINIKKFIRKYKNDFLLITIAIIILIIFALLFIFKIWVNVPTYVTHTGNKDEEQFIYDFTNDILIQQDFKCERKFDFITLSFSDHDKEINGKTIVSIKEKESEKTIYYGEIDNRQIHYGDYVEIPFEPKGRAHIVYTITLYEVQNEDISLGIYGFLVENTDMAAEVNGQKTDYALSIGIHSYTDLYKVLILFVAFTLMIMILICIWLTCKVTNKEEILFLSIAIPLGAIFLSFLSINPVHDGPTHLAKVYHYSNIILGRGGLDTGGYVYLSDDEAACFDSLFSDIYRENEQAQIFWEVYNDFGNSASIEDLVVSHEYRETSASSFWEYFPGILGMTIGRFFNGSARFNILLAKVFFYVFYVFSCYSAIKIAPRLKTVIAFTALLPMSIYQATGITYDSIVIAIVLLIIAFWLKAREVELSRREWLFVFILSYIIGCCKGGFYTIILFLFFLIPTSLLNGKKRLRCIVNLLVSCIAIVVTSWKAYLPYIKGMLGIQTNSGIFTEGVGEAIVENIPGKDEIAYGIMFIVREPLECAKIIINSFMEKADYYIGSLVGYRMAWSDDLIPWFVILIFIVLLALGTIQADEMKRKNAQLKDRVICVILLMVEVLAFHLLMLIETPVGNTVVNGVQGRYFIAWLPVLFIALGTKGYTRDNSATIRLYLYFCLAEVLYVFYFIRIFLGIH